MMEILALLLVAAVIGGVIAFFKTGKKEDITSGAAMGATMTAGCLLQLFAAGVMALLGIWLLSVVFG